jgi:hypothetical protein
MIKKLLFQALTASILLTSCQSKEGSENAEKISPDVVNNPATAQDAASAEANPVPEFTFETDTHHFGEIMQGEKVTYAFKFKNTGKAPLVISSASATCGCTVPEYTKSPVAPGEEGFISVTFDSSGKSGMTSKSVTLIANTIPNTKVLTVSADIQAPKTNS